MNGEFVAAMEDVLDLYTEPYDPHRPVICFDETSTQLLAEVRAPLPAQPAHQMQWLVDVVYLNAPVVRVVLDNLNTHRMASRYETFPAAEARRIAKRLEFHHTLKHASWLNPVLSLPKGWQRLNSAR